MDGFAYAGRAGLSSERDRASVLRYHGPSSPSMRARNLWGWGFLDRFPDEAGRRALAARVGAVLGEGAAAVRPLPVESALRLPPPRIAPPAALATFATADPVVRAAHTY